MKSGATARYAFDTGMAATEKQLTIDLGQKFRIAELGFHNADTALMVDQATATGNFSLAQANKQLAGAEKLHLELDLPYTQFLVDRATADADYAAEARQLLIGHALNINDAANIRITADQLASSITESANAAAASENNQPQRGGWCWCTVTIKRRLERFSSNRHYAEVVVRPDSYKEFRVLRDALGEMGLDYRLIPTSSDLPIIDRGGTSGKVQ